MRWNQSHDDKRGSENTSNPRVGLTSNPANRPVALEEVTGGEETTP